MVHFSGGYVNAIIYYAAYGSNLNKQQMRSRCPMAKPVSKAVLNGWQLVFRGVADIMPSPKAKVYLGIYSITPACEINAIFRGARRDLRIAPVRALPVLSVRLR